MSDWKEYGTLETREERGWREFINELSKTKELNKLLERKGNAGHLDRDFKYAFSLLKAIKEVEEQADADENHSHLRAYMKRFMRQLDYANWKLCHNCFGRGRACGLPCAVCNSRGYVYC